MVNTFITSKSYSKSASYLDRARLGKQRVEAYQILLLLQDLRAISRYFKISAPAQINEDEINQEIQGHFERGVWIKNIRLLYFRYLKKGNSPLLRRLNNGKERKITLGFSSHPILKMWVGYEESLKRYINIHIDEWVARGYKNTMKKYTIDPQKEILPWWIRFPWVKYSHKSSLLRKEKYRNEKEHYVKNPKFTSKTPENWKKCGYLWICNLDIEKIKEMILDPLKVVPEAICSPIQL